MNNNTRKNTLALGAMVATMVFTFSPSANAQFSGGTYGSATREEPLEAPLHEQKESVIHFPSHFHAGGPQAAALLEKLLKGVRVPFDGGDGPDYFELVGSDAADSLIGDTGEHDPFIPEFDGGDGPDYFELVGSDAADSLVLHVNIHASPAQAPLAHELTAGIKALLTSAFANLPLVVGGEAGEALAEQLAATGNEVAIFGSTGVSLKATGNEVAFAPLVETPLAQQWNEWNFIRSFEKTSEATFPVGEWATEIDDLFSAWQSGTISRSGFEESIHSIAEEIFALNGIQASVSR